jgi:hypothetical protein
MSEEHKGLCLTSYLALHFTLLSRAEKRKQTRANRVEWGNHL